MDKSNSFKATQNPWSADFGLGATDRRLAFSRQASFQQYREPPHTPVSINLNDSEATPFLSRSLSSIDVPPGAYLTEESDKLFGDRSVSAEKLSVLVLFESVFRILRSGNRYMKRLFLLISLNVAYSTVELFIGLFTGRIGLVSDSFHLSFGCGLLTFSLFAMAASRKKPDGIYTYGYKRLEVLSAFTNALFLLFMSFSLAVEALHAFIQDESEHKFNSQSLQLGEREGFEWEQGTTWNKRAQENFMFRGFRERVTNHLKNLEQLLSAFALDKEPYMHTLEEESTPFGLLARGIYAAKLKEKRKATKDTEG